MSKKAIGRFSVIRMLKDSVGALYISKESLLLMLNQDLNEWHESPPDIIVTTEQYINDLIKRITDLEDDRGGV